MFIFTQESMFNKDHGVKTYNSQLEKDVRADIKKGVIEIKDTFEHLSICIQDVI